jgi:cupin superfamily acireductone dioxygenase involved in methionine salvage
MFGFFRRTKKNTPDKKSQKVDDEEIDDLIKDLSISEEEQKKIMDEMEQYEKENEKMNKKMSKKNEKWDDEELLKELEKLIEEEEKKEKKGGYKIKKRKMKGGANFKEFFEVKISSSSPKLQGLFMKYYESYAHLFVNRDINKLISDREYYTNRVKNNINDKRLKYFYISILFLVKSIIEFKNSNSRTKSMSAGYTRKINKYRKTSKKL